MVAGAGVGPTSVVVVVVDGAAVVVDGARVVLAVDVVITYGGIWILPAAGLWLALGPLSLWLALGWDRAPVVTSNPPRGRMRAQVQRGMICVSS